MTLAYSTQTNPTKKIEIEVDNISNWLNTNKLTLNVKKSKSPSF